MVSSSVCGLVATIAVLTLQGATETSAQDTASQLYISSFNQFCSGSLPHTDEFYLRKQTKCWICEDLVKGYVKSKAAGDPYMPPAGTDFSPDPRTTYTLGGDFFVFGYDADGFYQVKPTWNDATQAGWPPPYTCDCKNSYDEDLSSCKSACGGTYTIPPTSERPDDIIAQHDESLTEGGTSYYAEKIEHQYELTALAPQGAFFHVRRSTRACCAPPPLPHPTHRIASLVIVTLRACRVSTATSMTPPGRRSSRWRRRVAMGRQTAASSRAHSTTTRGRPASTRPPRCLPRPPPPPPRPSTSARCATCEMVLDSLGVLL